jgi:hypothetical protein
MVKLVGFEVLGRLLLELFFMVGMRLDLHGGRGFWVVLERIENPWLL